MNLNGHETEWEKLAPKCKEVANVMDSLARLLFGQDLLCTSIFRRRTTDSGIHEQYRAIDFAPLHDITDTYRLITILNAIYTYDPLRLNMSVVHPNPYHGTAPHIHVQVHANTCVTTKLNLMQLLAQASRDRSNFRPVDLA